MPDFLHFGSRFRKSSRPVQCFSPSERRGGDVVRNVLLWIAVQTVLRNGLYCMPERWVSWADSDFIRE